MANPFNIDTALAECSSDLNVISNEVGRMHHANASNVILQKILDALSCINEARKFLAVYPDIDGVLDIDFVSLPDVEYFIRKRISLGLSAQQLANQSPISVSAIRTMERTGKCSATTKIRLIEFYRNYEQH